MTKTNEKPTLTTYNVKDNKHIKSIDLRFKLIETMREFGWELDRFGHLKKEENNRIWRLKLSTKSFRYEYKSTEPRSKWYNYSNGCLYYKQINVYSNGHLTIVKAKTKPKTKPRKIDSGLQSICDGKGYILTNTKSLDEKIFTESEFKASDLYATLKAKLPEKVFKMSIEELEKGTELLLSEHYVLKMINKSNDLLFHGGLRQQLLKRYN